MTYEELKTKLNNLPHTRFRAQCVKEIYDASIAAGFENFFDFIEEKIKENILRPAPKDEFEDETLQSLAVEMLNSGWAKAGFPGVRSPVDTIKRFLSEYGGLWDKTYDDLTGGEQRMWQVFRSFYGQWKSKNT